MSIYEYDEAKHIQLERNEAREEGRQEGRQEGIKALIEACQEFNASKEDTIQKILQKYALPTNDAQEYVTQYWKVNT